MKKDKPITAFRAANGEEEILYLADQPGHGQVLHSPDGKTTPRWRSWNSSDLASSTTSRSRTRAGDSEASGTATTPRWCSAT